MGLLFKKYGYQQCCLCGEKDRLTGEHKIKASALKGEFGETMLLVGNSNDSLSRRKYAQSTNSKNLKFKSRICEACNSAHTQPADLEFDKFNALIRKILESGDDPKLAFRYMEYDAGSQAYLNVFRYFAKLLCCHLAEIDAPIPLRLSGFALGVSDTNCIWLDIQKDWSYQKTKEHYGDHQYAAHGGLVVYGDRLSGNANAFHSTLTIGPTQYVFLMRLVPLEQLEIRLMYRPFFKWCKSQILQAMKSPIPDDDKKRIGLLRP